MKIKRVVIISLISIGIMLVSSSFVNKINAEFSSTMANPYEIEDSSYIIKLNSIDRTEKHSDDNTEYIDLTLVKDDFSYFTKTVTSALLKGKTNFIYSPLSLYFNLLLLQFASSEESTNAINDLIYHTGAEEVESKNDLLCHYHHRLVKNGASIANSTWVDSKYEVLGSYITKANSFYTEVFSTNFQNGGLEKMADWVNYYTDNLLNMKSDDFGYNIVTTFYMLSTLNIDMKHNVKYINDHKGEFNGKGNVQYIKTKERFAGYYLECDNYYVLTSTIGSFWIYFVVPNENYLENHEITELFDEDSLYEDTFKSLTRRASVDLTMPEFSFTDKIDFWEYLDELGLSSLVDSSKPFTNIISNDKDVAVTMIHPTQHIYFNLDKTGVKAGTATVTKGSGCQSMNPGPMVDIVIDSPFIFFVGDELPLYTGVITEL